MESNTNVEISLKNAACEFQQILQLEDAEGSFSGTQTTMAVFRSVSGGGGEDVDFGLLGKGDD